MKYLLAGLFFSVTTSCSHVTFEQISKKIDQSRDYSSYKIYSPFFHPYRMAIKKNGELKFINWRNDTFYIQEVFYTEASPMMIGTIWNKKGLVNYTYIGSKREIPGIQLVDSNLIRYLYTPNTNIVDYYKKLPEHLVKNQYYFEKVAVNKNTFSILEKVQFEY